MQSDGACYVVRFRLGNSVDGLVVGIGWFYRSKRRHSEWIVVDLMLLIVRGIPFLTFEMSEVVAPRQWRRVCVCRLVSSART